jgi:hypothetical protein
MAVKMSVVGFWVLMWFKAHTTEDGLAEPTHAG